MSSSGPDSGRAGQPRHPRSVAAAPAGPADPVPGGPGAGRARCDRFWAVRWDLPPGVAHQQQVLTHPGANASVGHANGQPGQSQPGPVEARLNGVARGLSTRVLVGQGWTIAALTRPGGLGAFVSGSAADFTDRIVPLGQALGTDEAALLAQVTAEPDEAARVALLAAALEQAVRPERRLPAGRVAGVARLAEADRAVRRLSDLCDLAGLGPRTLQRMFLQYAGVSPTWVIRRYRLLEAAESVREGKPVSWTEIAAGLGYADQAHLTRDFRAATGQTPAAYAGAQLSRLPVPPGPVQGPGRVQDRGRCRVRGGCRAGAGPGPWPVQDREMPRRAPHHDRDAGGPAGVLAAKAALRQEVWAQLSAARVARFPGAPGRIPNFTGAEAAAQRLRGLEPWQEARTLKANPDAAQWPVRQRALEDGKTVYMAVPRLASPEPFFALDPAHLGEPPRRASSISGASRSARQVRLADLGSVDLVVMGSVAAGQDGARLGKGGGFADLEFALAAAAGLIGPRDRGGHDRPRAAGTPGRDHPADRPRCPGRLHRRQARSGSSTAGRPAGSARRPASAGRTSPRRRSRPSRCWPRSARRGPSLPGFPTAGSALGTGAAGLGASLRPRKTALAMRHANAATWATARMPCGRISPNRIKPAMMRTAFVTIVAVPAAVSASPFW